MFRREMSTKLEKRLREPRGLMQIVTGPRQTGKTTAINQAIEALGFPYRVGRADDVFGDARWIEAQ